jgi:hypothetical protein
MSPLVALYQSNFQSMFIDVVVAIALGVHGVDANPPPKPYDHPYTGPVQIVKDLPADGSIWGFTEPPKVKGGTCVIHLAPLGSTFETEDGIELLEAVGRPKLIRHEMGHCNGLVHPTVREYWKWKLAPAPQRPKTSQPRRVAPYPGPGWPPAW